MKSNEEHIRPESEYYVCLPSAMAKSAFFYPVCVGRFFYEPGYRPILFHPPFQKAYRLHSARIYSHTPPKYSKISVADIPRIRQRDLLSHRIFL